MNNPSQVRLVCFNFPLHLALQRFLERAQPYSFQRGVLPPSLPPCFPLASSPALDARSLQREQLFELSNRALALAVVCQKSS